MSASLRTLTSSLFPALKFIEKRHCFFKIALAAISGSVHCWGNRTRVEIDIRGPRARGAYHQRTSCGAGCGSQQVLNASFQTWVRGCSHQNLLLFYILYIKFQFDCMWLHFDISGTVRGRQKIRLFFVSLEGSYSPTDAPLILWDLFHAWDGRATFRRVLSHLL